jgi:hypothetical protein
VLVLLVLRRKQLVLVVAVEPEHGTDVVLRLVVAVVLEGRGAGGGPGAEGGGEG